MATEKLIGKKYKFFYMNLFETNQKDSYAQFSCEGKAKRGPIIEKNLAHL
jgi:hypothetical protein